MNNHSDVKKLIEHLYKKEFLSDSEWVELENWLSTLKTNQRFEDWIQSNWDLSEDISVEIQFETVKQLTRKKANNPTRRVYIINQLQRIAAILVISLVLASSFIISQRIYTPENWVSMKMAKAERTHITFHDGSDIWFFKLLICLQYSG